MEIFKLFGRILIDNDEANQSIARTEKRGQGVVGTFGKMITTAVKWGAAIGAAGTAAGGAMLAMANRTAAYADEVDKTSMKLGIHTDVLQEMRYVAGQVGVSHDSMDRAMGRLNQRIGAASEGHKKYREGLERLGISMDDVEAGTVSTSDAFMQAIQSLHEIEDAQLQAKLAGDLFGTQLGRQLMPAIKAGGAEMEALRDQAHELGLVMSEESIESGVKFADTMDTIKQTLGTVTREIGMSVMPIMQIFLDWFLERLPDIRAVFSTVFTRVNEILAHFVDWAQENIFPIVQALMERFRQAMPVIQNIAVTAFESVMNIGERLAEIFNEVILPAVTALWDFISPHFPDIKDLAEDAFGLMEEMVNVAADAILWLSDKLQEHWDIVQPILIGIASILATRLIVQWIRAGITAVTSAAQQAAAWVTTQAAAIKAAAIHAVNIAKMVAGWVLMGAQSLIAAAKVAAAWIIATGPIGLIVAGVIAAIAVIIAVWHKWGDDIKEFFQSIWSWIKNTWDSSLGWVADKVMGFVDSITGFFGNMKDGMQDIWSDIVDWLKGLPTQMFEMGKDLIQGLINGVKNMGKGAVDAVKGVGSSIVNGVKGIFGIKSPSKLFEEFGNNLGEGLALGIEGTESLVGSAADDMAMAATPELDVNGGGNSSQGSPRHFIFELVNAPDNIDRGAFVEMLRSALQDPEVKRDIDRVNYQNMQVVLRPKGV